MGLGTYLTCQPFIATSDLGLGLTPGGIYFRSDQKLGDPLDPAAGCKHVIGIPHRRTADGKLELQICGGAPFGNKFLLGQPSTRPDQFVAEVGLCNIDPLKVTLTAGGNNSFRVSQYEECPLVMSCACFAGAYDLPALELVPCSWWAVTPEGGVAGESALDMPTNCLRIRQLPGSLNYECTRAWRHFWVSVGYWHGAWRFSYEHAEVSQQIISMAWSGSFLYHRPSTLPICRCRFCGTNMPTIERCWPWGCVEMNGWLDATLWIVEPWEYYSPAGQYVPPRFELGRQYAARMLVDGRDGYYGNYTRVTNDSWKVSFSA